MPHCYYPLRLIPITVENAIFADCKFLQINYHFNPIKWKITSASQQHTMLNAFNRIGTRININNPKDITKYAIEWHISEDVLTTAIRKVGFLKAEIAGWLKENGYL